MVHALRRLSAFALALAVGSGSRVARGADAQAPAPTEVPAQAAKTLGDVNEAVATGDLLAHPEQVESMGFEVYAGYLYLLHKASGFGAASGVDPPKTFKGRKLLFDLEPIQLAFVGGHVFLSGRDPRKGVVQLEYATSRAFSSGGEYSTNVSSSTLARDFGVSSLVTDILLGTLQYSGARLTGKLARFTAGSIYYTDWSETKEAASDIAPGQLEYLRVQAVWDFRVRGEGPGGALELGLAPGMRYVRTNAPRIVSNILHPDAGNARDYVVWQSAPTNVRSDDLLVGGVASIGARFGGKGGDGEGPPVATADGGPEVGKGEMRMDGWVDFFGGGGQAAATARYADNGGALLTGQDARGNCGTYRFEGGGGGSASFGWRASKRVSLFIGGKFEIEGTVGACTATKNVTGGTLATSFGVLDVFLSGGGELGGRF